MPSLEGNLSWAPIAERLDDVAKPVADAVNTVPSARVAIIDPHLADTAAFCDAYDVDPAASANCVVVTGRRGETKTTAAVLVLATDKADINGVVRRHLGARKISFADQSETEVESGMVRGGITPVGLPSDWKLLIDERVVERGEVLVGGGVRGAKIIVDAAELAGLPQAEVLTLAMTEETS
ncbi:hypothetical protein EVU97_03635 [Dermacoccus sp. 147Ba]|uniref:YbaK/EbsC family protein n=1 Tax=Dermacoccus sp. 147Ba TaxID=2510111 RepID=UPI00101C322E|nr:YbaK/EbsC family protein [Dermacoccus sp. 147Ba]RYI23780.1 hypothetical protein EVU97_03635 [Dermacoccus sp. 147Ba]